MPKIISNSFASCARLSTKDLALPSLQLCNTTTISPLRLYMPKNLTIVFSTAGFHPSCRRLSYQIRLYSFLRFINNIISSACNISVLQVCLLAGWRKFLQAACTNPKWLAKPALKHWLSLHLFAIRFALCFKSIKNFIPNLKSETTIA